MPSDHRPFESDTWRRNCLYMKNNGKWTYQESIDMEIKRLAFKLKGECRALLQLPLKIYSQILEDNKTRKKPYKVSLKRIERIILSISEDLLDK